MFVCLASIAVHLWAGAAVSAVVKVIEERIANATGIPIHADEDLISLARITSRGKTPRRGHFAPFGLHHVRACAIGQKRP